MVAFQVHIQVNPVGNHDGMMIYMDQPLVLCMQQNDLLHARSILATLSYLQTYLCAFRCIGTKDLLLLCGLSRAGAIYGLIDCEYFKKNIHRSYQAHSEIPPSLRLQSHLSVLDIQIPNLYSTVNLSGTQKIAV